MKFIKSQDTSEALFLPYKATPPNASSNDLRKLSSCVIAGLGFLLRINGSAREANQMYPTNLANFQLPSGALPSDTWRPRLPVFTRLHTRAAADIFNS